MKSNQKIEVEQPKQDAPASTPAVVETKTRKTPVNERTYTLIAVPSIPPKGKQRQIVLGILAEDKANGGTGMTVKQVTKLATERGLQAVGGVEPSCRYHLHHLVLLNLAKVENPTITVEVEKPAETVAA